MIPSIAALADGIAVKVLSHSGRGGPLRADASLVLVRSSSYGDFTTFLPFVAEAVKRIGKEQVGILLLSRHGQVGEALLGNASEIPIVTFDASSLAHFPREFLRAGRSARRLRHDQVLFCGPAMDSPLPRLKRWLLTRALVGIRVPAQGFGINPPLLRPSEARAYGGRDVVNQAFMPFVQIGLEPSVDRAAVLGIVGLNESERKRAAQVVIPHLRMIGMYVGSRLTRKRWPRDRFAELANRLLRDPSLGIVFLGGEEDLPAIGDVVRDVRETRRVSIGAGVLSLRETIALGQHLAVYIGNDGAPGHLSALGGSPVVSIFCDWEPPGIWEPILAPASRSLRPSPVSNRLATDYRIDTVSIEAVECATIELLGGACGHEIIEFDDRQLPGRRVVRGFPL